MINPDDSAAFPNNVVQCLAVVLPGIDADLRVLKRPLRPTDPDHSIGIYGTLWEPEEDSYEIRGAQYPVEATLQQYYIGIQALTKHSDTQAALNVSSILAKRIRGVVYRNVPLRVALSSLYVQDGDSRESMRRWGIRGQRYISNDIEKKFVFVSVMDLWIETEMQ